MIVVELHAFGNASEKSYGACVYLKLDLPDGTYSVSLFMLRGRVAPFKYISRSRLKLSDAVVCARLVTYFKSALHLEVPVFCWTESTVILL